MEAKNLRIGNLITIHDQLQEIVELPLPENCTKENTKGIYLNYKTEHLLKDNLQIGSELGYYELSDGLEINIDYCVYCGRKFLVELKYVHELQNLFFAIKKTELDVSKMLSD